MGKDDIIRKLTSRKFWAAVAEFVTMLIVAFKGSEETAVQVSALIMAGAAVIAYIIGEGLVDAAGTIPDIIYDEGDKAYLNGSTVEKPPEADIEEAMEKAEDW